MVARMRAWAVWSLVGLSGCATIEGPRIQTTAPERSFRAVEITFDRFLPLPSGESSPAETPREAEARLVSFETRAVDSPNVAAAGADGRRQRLMIRAPHPDGRRDWAQVSLVIESLLAEEKAGVDKHGPARGWRKWTRQIESRLPGIRWGEGVDEAWVCDVPASEIEALVVRLERSGYFDESNAASAGGSLAVEIDGQLTRRVWPGSPELESLIRQVREKGQLASYVPVPEGALLEPTALAGEARLSAPLDAAPVAEPTMIEPPTVELPTVELPPGELPPIVARALPLAPEAGLARIRRLPPVGLSTPATSPAVMPVSFSQ